MRRLKLGDQHRVERREALAGELAQSQPRRGSLREGVTEAGRAGLGVHEQWEDASSTNDRVEMGCAPPAARKVAEGDIACVDGRRELNRAPVRKITVKAPRPRLAVESDLTPPRVRAIATNTTTTTEPPLATAAH